MTLGAGVTPLHGAMAICLAALVCRMMGTRIRNKEPHQVKASRQIFEIFLNKIKK